MRKVNKGSRIRAWWWRRAGWWWWTELISCAANESMVLDTTSLYRQKVQLSVVIMSPDRV